MSFEVEHIGACTLYRGDCREILPHLSAVDAVITDPVWPNCQHVFPGIDAEQLCREGLALCEASRVVLHLGMNSDPRFLQCVPSRWPFLRVCYLEYAAVGYHGRLLRDAEVAYAFGVPPPSKPGAHVLPGRVIATKSNGDKGWDQSRGNVNDKIAMLPHPSVRNLQHVAWLVKWFGAGCILDPFMGTGTTGISAVGQGFPFIGIEYERGYFDLACQRIAAAYVQPDMFYPRLHTAALRQERLL